MQGQAWRRVAAALVFVFAAAPALAAPYAAVVMDARNGAVLHAEGADRRLHPASLTKMMTLYLVFEAVQAGRLRLDQRITISAHAARRPAVKLGLKPGQRVPLQDLIRAAAVMSANDAATALAEAVGGSERDFARMMTAKAAALGMTNSAFRNPHGLSEPGHYSSPRDMAILARRLLHDFPQFYNIFGRVETPALGRTLRNTNRLLTSYPGADGIKTGYTRAAGYNLAASAEREGRRVIVVVFGARSSNDRSEKVARLLDLGLGRAPARVPVEPPPPLLEPGVLVAERPRPRGTPPETLAERSLRAVADAVLPAAAAAELPKPPASPAPPAAAIADAGPAVLVAERPPARPRRPAATPPARQPPAAWAVQLGAYRERSTAVRTLARAQALKLPAMKGARHSVERTRVNGVPLYEARLTGLTRSRAEALCARLPDPCRLQPEGAGR